MQCSYNEIPVDQGRSTIKSSIEYYAKRRIRKCVAIKIRNWYALVDERKLTEHLVKLELEPKSKLLLPSTKGTTSAKALHRAN